MVDGKAMLRENERGFMTKRGIIIANTGSPSAPTPEAVRTYLSAFLTDPRICPMNPAFWKFLLKTCILPRRSVASAKKYASIWTPDGSPLTLIMDLLATRLQDALDAFDGGRSIVRSAMSYGRPSLHDVMERFEGEGIEELVVIPLYPQGAYSTTMVVEDQVLAALHDLEWKPKLTFVKDYCTSDVYIDAIARSVLSAGFDPEVDKLLLAFHSIPMKDIEAGDSYPEQVFSSAAAIAARTGAPEGAWAVGFQCRFDKSRKWLGPYVVESMDRLYGELSESGGRLFVVTPNFSIDCLETLFDIEVELKQAFFQRYPVARSDDFVYVPCLNDSDDQVSLLASIVSK